MSPSLTDGFTNPFDINLNWEQTDLQNHNWNHSQPNT